ncbi:MAG TPA: hypothetical protein VLN72_05645 [Gillisia sp.]|nr:hypothetical protein [Gillisia sp.]
MILNNRNFMNQVRILALILLLLSGNSFGFAIPAGNGQVSLENENSFDLTEDYQDLSFSNLVQSLDLFTKRFPISSEAILLHQNSQEISRSKSYFSNSYLIEPGLGLKDIIFPFHSFL